MKREATLKGLYALVGMQFRPQEAKDHFAKLPNGAPLTLKREPTNQYDANAIQVWSGDFHIGFISSKVNKPLAMAMDAAVPTTIDGQPNECALPSMPAKLAIDGGKWPLCEVEE